MKKMRILLENWIISMTMASLLALVLKLVFHWLWLYALSATGILYLLIAYQLLSKGKATIHLKPPATSTGESQSNLASIAQSVEIHQSEQGSKVGPETIHGRPSWLQRLFSRSALEYLFYALILIIVAYKTYF